MRTLASLFFLLLVAAPFRVQGASATGGASVRVIASSASVGVIAAGEAVRSRRDITVAAVQNGDASLRLTLGKPAAATLVLGSQNATVGGSASNGVKVRRVVDTTVPSGFVRVTLHTN